MLQRAASASRAAATYAAVPFKSAYQLAVGQTVSTMMACEPTLMAVDKAITAALAKPLD
ncbi:MAG: META domain-containing protein, partial [Xylophilus sp.]|nr:META domain-containing protein [Xylophilus sp.]